MHCARAPAPAGPPRERPARTPPSACAPCVTNGLVAYGADCLLQMSVLPACPKFDNRLRPNKWRFTGSNRMPDGGVRSLAPGGFYGLMPVACRQNEVEASSSVCAEENTRVASATLTPQLDAAKIQLYQLGLAELKNLQEIGLLAHKLAAKARTLQNQVERTVIPLAHWFTAARTLGFDEFAKLCLVGHTSWETEGGEQFTIRNHPHAVSMTRGQQCGAHTDKLNGGKDDGLWDVLGSSYLLNNWKYIIKWPGLDHWFTVFAASANCGHPDSIRLFRLWGGCIVVGTECALAQTVHGAVRCEKCDPTSPEELRGWQRADAEDKLTVTGCGWSFMLNLQGGQPAEVARIIRRSLTTPVVNVHFDWKSVPHADLPDGVGLPEFVLCKQMLASNAPVVFWAGASSLPKAPAGSPSELAAVPFLLQMKNGKWAVVLSAKNGTRYALGARLGLVSKSGTFITRGQCVLTEFGDHVGARGSSDVRYVPGRRWGFTVQGQSRVLDDYPCEAQAGVHKEIGIRVSASRTADNASSATQHALGGAPPPPSAADDAQHAGKVPLPNADEVFKRSFGREQVVAALKEHFPSFSHKALGRKQGDATELKARLLGLVEGGDGGLHPAAAGGGGGAASKAARVGAPPHAAEYEDAVATQQRASADEEEMCEVPFFPFLSEHTLALRASLSLPLSLSFALSLSLSLSLSLYALKRKPHCRSRRC